MVAKAEDPVAPVVKRLALIFALSVTTLLPAGYFGVRYAAMVEHAEVTARIKADVVSTMVARNPEMWIYELQRMEELLSQFPVQIELESVSVRNPAGDALVTAGAPPAAPVLRRAAGIKDSGRVVGQVEIVRSYRPVMIGTLTAALLGLLLGIAVYATLLVLPLRALHRATEALSREKAALADSESRFRSLTAMSSDFYWESDTEHRLTQRNTSKREAAESVFHQASPIGKRRWEIPYLSPDESGWQQHREILDAHLPFREFEISRRAADGRERYILISGDPVLDAAGEFKGYRGVGSDITERKEHEEDLRRFRAAMDATEDAIYLVERANLRFVDVNAAASAALGLTREQILELGPEGVLSMPREELARIYDAVIAGGDATKPVELRRTRRDGRQVWIELRRHARQSEKGWTIVTVARDITERKLAEANLRIAATAFEAQEGMVVTDADSVILRVNRAFTEITGYSAEEAVGQTPRLLRSGRHDANFYRAMWDSLLASGEWRGEIWNRRKNGEVYPEWLTITAVKDGAGTITHYVATLTDITRRKAAEEEIKNLAFYDPLTQLPNRRLLMDRLHQALASSDRSRHRAALLFIDLDHFKTLNDTLGHDKGDLLLQQVAQRLSACVRASDTVARLGGDEFVVMLEDLSESAEQANLQTRTIAEKILSTFNQPYLLAGHAHHSSGSIGIAPFCGHEQSATALLKHADIAMYQAKAAGRNGLRFFEPGMQAASTAGAQGEPAPGAAVEATPSVSPEQSRP